MKEDIVNIPLNGEQIQFLNPDSKIVTYITLQQYKHIDDLFRDTDKVIILYLTESEYFGHWCCLFKHKRDGKIVYNFFDPYGIITDGQLEFVADDKRKKLKEEHAYLSWLLRDSPCFYNYIVFQNKRTQTCGCHVTYRLHNSDLTIKDYTNKLFLEKGITNPDKFVAEYCFSKL